MGKFRKISYCLLILLLCICVNICDAADNNTLKNPESSAVQSTTAIVDPTEEIGNKTISEVRQEYKQEKEAASPVSVFANLITLLLIMFVLAWAYQKYGKNALDKVLANQALKKNDIKILSTASLGANKFLHIVEAGDEKILIGSTNTNITLLKELKDIKEKAVSDE